MATVFTERLMTTDELLAMPDDGIERWLIDGHLREGQSMTKRNRWHAQLESRISQLLGNWLDGQPAPRGELLAGEAGVRLRQNPDTTVGIDVAYISAAVAADDGGDSTIIEGVPVLAIEILSPHDQVEEIEEKVDTYLDVGVQAVWVVNPYRKTVLVARPGQEPVLFNIDQELIAEPYLPGFRVRVASIFSR